MRKTKEGILYHSKPTFWYYLLGAFFPLVLLFAKKGPNQLINTVALVIFASIPILMVVFRREVIIYSDKVCIVMPAISSSKTHFFKDLVSWKMREFYFRGT